MLEESLRGSFDLMTVTRGHQSHVVMDVLLKDGPFKLFWGFELE